jgi:hypothetical protein
MKKNLSRNYPKILIVLSIFFAAPYARAQEQFKGLENLFTVPKGYVVGYVKTPPVIDGDVNDPVWQQAKWSDDFVDIEGDLKPHPPLQTNIKMLWSDSSLYIAARVMEPNVWAYLKNHDDIVFLDNDVEMFINPNNSMHQYYEIECNAINTIFDLYLNKPYRNGGNPVSAWNTPGMQSAVKVQGTVNDPSDNDQGWTMEMVIPFRALGLGNRFQQPKDGAIWRINFSRVEWDTKVVNGKYEKLKGENGRNLPEHNWSWSPQGLIAMHCPERWGYLQFTKGDAGDKTFTLPYAEKQKEYLWLVYYKQKEWFKKHKAYAVTLDELGIDSRIAIDTNKNTLQLEATPHLFMALITDTANNVTWTINQEGLVSILKKDLNE